jgi:hypothetical protein
MGAIIAIALITIVLISVGYALWALYALARDAASFVRSPRRSSGETAAHYEPGDHEHVSTKPLQGYQR